MRTRRTKEQIRKDNYNKDVDAYNFYVVNLDTKRAETGFQFKEDAVDVLNDYDDKKKYKVVSKRALKSMGIENPNESFKYEGGGDFQSGVYATGGSLIGNQKRIDLNKNGKIDAEDFKLLRTTMNGAWRKDHKYVNSSNPKEDYEVIYARKYKPSRKGYKGKTNFATGGGVDRFSEYSNDALYDMIINLSRYENTESEIQMVKEELEKRKANKKMATGGGIGIQQEIDLTDDKKLRLRKPVMPERKYSEREWAEKFNPRAYEFMGKRKMANGGDLITETADAIFYANVKNGKIKTSFGDKTKEGLLNMLTNVNYDRSEIVDAIFDSNEKNGKINTGFGAKTKEGLSQMIKNMQNTFANGGGVDYEYDGIAYAKTKALQSIDWDKELREYAGSEYSKLTTREKEEIISDMQRDWNSRHSFANGGGVEKLSFEDWLKKNNIEVYKRTYYWVADDGGNDYMYSGSKSDVMKSLREDYKKSFATGGGISKFKMLSDKVAKNYEGKRVKPQYQKEYGKVYSKSEAKEVGDKVAGKVKANQKMATGGTINSGYFKNEIDNDYIDEINKYFNKWNNIRDEKDSENFKNTKPPMFGTYKSDTIIQQINHFEKIGIPFQANEVLRNQFKKEVSKIIEKYLNQKMTTGGQTKKGGQGGIMVLAKQIRKDGESWKDALKRAGQQLK